MGVVILSKPLQDDWPISQSFAEHMERAIENNWCTKPGPCESGIYYYPGIDYAANMYTRVHAAAKGLFEVRDEGDQGYGLSGRIYHDRGYTTVYGHLVEIRALHHTVVEQGQIIGLVGTSGNSTGPHLHFELRAAGIPVNPELFYGQGLPIPDIPVVQGGSIKLPKQRMFTKKPRRGY